MAAQDGGGRRHARRGHRRTRPCCVAVARQRGKDAHARRRQLIFAVCVLLIVPVGEGRERPALIRRHHAEDVGIARGVNVGLSDVFGGCVGRGDAVVACRGHEHAVGERLGQRLLHKVGLLRAAKGHIDHVRAHCIRIVDGLGNIARGERAGGLTGLDGHDLRAPREADAALAVAAHADDARHVRAVPVVVHRVARLRAACGNIHAVVVIDIAVVVIVDAIARDLARVDPHICRKILVRVVHAGINDRYNGARAGVDLLAQFGRPPELIRPFQQLVDDPAFADLDLLRHAVAVGMVDVVQLRVGHAARFPERGHRRRFVAGAARAVPHRRTALALNALRAAKDRLPVRKAERGKIQQFGRHALAEREKHHAGHKFRVRAIRFRFLRLLRRAVGVRRRDAHRPKRGEICLHIRIRLRLLIKRRFIIAVAIVAVVVTVLWLEITVLLPDAVPVGRLIVLHGECHGRRAHEHCKRQQPAERSFPEHDFSS